MVGFLWLSSPRLDSGFCFSATALQISYNGVLSACSHAGEWRAALRVLKVMREAGMAPNVYNYSAASELIVWERERNTSKS